MVHVQLIITVKRGLGLLTDENEGTCGTVKKREESWRIGAKYRFVVCPVRICWAELLRTPCLFHPPPPQPCAPPLTPLLPNLSNLAIHTALALLIRPLQPLGRPFLPLLLRLCYTVPVFPCLSFGSSPA